VRVDGFNPSDVARMSGLSLRQLRYLAQTGLLVASLRQASGPGSSARYSFEDLLRAAVIGRVRQVCGVEVRSARLRRMMDVLAARRSDGLLVIEPEGCWVQDGDDAAAVASLTEAALIVDLAAVRRRLQLAARREGLPVVEAA